MTKYLLSLISFLFVLQSQAQESSVNFQSDNLTLNGTLYLPNGTGPFPIAVFSHGSGPNDRNQTLHLTGGNSQCLFPQLYNDTVRNFKDLAHQLAQHGIASLRYDKRTFTYTGQLPPQAITPYDFAQDLHAAIDFVKTLPDVKEDQIMLLGHSQGANLIPIVARQRTDISHLIALGTGSRGIDTLLATQLQQLYYRCAQDTAGGDAIFSQTTSDFLKIRNGTWPATTPKLGAFRKFWSDWMDITDSSIINYNQISHPTLFLQAEDDFNVPNEEAQRLEANITRDSVDLYYLNGLNHYFTPDSVSIVSPVVADTIYHWLQKIKAPPVSVKPLEQQQYEIIVTQETERVTLSLLNKKNFSDIVLFDLSGRRILHKTGNLGTQFSFSKHGLQQGLYIVSGIIDQKHSFSKKVLFTEQ